jgi:hypothetical protein
LKEHIAALLDGVFKSVVVALVLVALMGLCYATMRPASTLGSSSKHWVFVQLILLVLAWRLSWHGSWAAVRASLATPRQWGRWLLWLGLGPVALAIAGYFVIGVLVDGLDARRPLAVLAKAPWALLALALAMSMFTVWFGKRVRTISAPVEKYLAVGQSAPQRKRRPGIAPAIFGAVLAFGVLLQTLSWFGGAEMQAQRQSITSAASATLTEAYEVRGSRGQRCELSKGARLTQLRVVPASDNRAKQWSAKVPSTPLGCDWLDKAEVQVPDALLRIGGVDAASLPARVTESTRTGPSVPSTSPMPPTPPARSAVVSGAVKSLSSEGWPQINGSTVPLHGLADIEAGQRKRFQSWLKNHDNQLRCEAVAGGRSRCLTASGVDAAEALLLNGVTRAAPGAPTHYQEAMAQAQAAQRGLWRN